MGKHLFVVLVFIILFFVVFQLYDFLAVKMVEHHSSNVIYNEEDNKTYIDLTNNQLCFLNKGWKVVLGANRFDALRSSFDEEYLNNHQVATDISFTRLGFRDIMEYASWDIENRNDLNPYNNKDEYSILYINKIKVPIASQISLLTPSIKGRGYIYSNGVFIGSFGDNLDSSVKFDITGGVKSLPLLTDQYGNSTIAILVKADSSCYAPGILSIPIVASPNTSITPVSISAIWLSILVLIAFIPFSCGIIISRTFINRKRYCVALVLVLLFYICIFIEGKYLSLPSSIESLGLFFCELVISYVGFILIHSFMVDISGRTNAKAHPKYFYIIYSVIAVLVVIAAFIPAGVYFKDMYLRYAGQIFGIISMAISLIAIILLFKGTNRGVFAIVESITLLFFFVLLNSNYIKILNIPLYSIVFVLAFLVALYYFLSEYVKQNAKLKEISNQLEYRVREKTLHISEINRDLYNTNKKLLENEEARRNVLSNVSHDLRTPITAIRGYAELLLGSGDKLQTAQRELYLNNIVKRSKQMENIVSDIVELTRMESNTNEFKFIEMSIAELLDELVMLYDGDLRGTKKELKLNLPEDDLLITRADPKKISRVFENLISNAINYSYDIATIEVSAWRTPEDRKIHIEVKDNGIGIPEESLPLIFDRFYRAKNSGQNIKGTGLGLSIVKLIVDHHEADISVESTLGTGTTFHITLKGISE